MAAEEYFSPALCARFDLVAMDPRGMGNNMQVNCSVDLFTPQVDTWAETLQRLRLGREFALHMQGASDTWRPRSTAATC